MALIDLAHNVGLLVTLLVVHRILTRRWSPASLRMRVLSGLMYGAIGLLGMLAPIRFAEGTIFDARTVVLAVAGLFGGPLVAAIAASACGAYRYALGGDGVWVGLATIVESAALGVLFHYIRRREPRVTDPLPLFGVGALVHGAMLGLMLLLPHGAGLEVVQRLGPIILFAYPLATVLVGRVVVDGEQRLAAAASLARGEEQLLAVNALLDSTLEHTHVMAVYLDTAFNFVWVNRAYAETCRHERSFFPGKNHFELYPNEENRAIFQRVLETGEPAFVSAKPFEFPDQPERGTTYWDWSLVPVRAGGSEVTGLVFTLIDVTDRERAEAHLRESETKFAKSFASAPVLMAITDLASGVYLDVNERALEVAGFDRSEVVGRTATAIGWVTPRDRARMAEAVRSGDGLRGMEVEFRAKDGRTVVGLVSGERIGVSGRDCLLTVTADITERKRAEEALRQGEATFRSLFEEMAQGVLYQDAEGRIVAANPAAERILGLTLDQMRGVTSADPRWRSIREDFSEFPGEEHPVVVARRTGREVRDVVMGVYHPVAQEHRWIIVSAVPQFASEGTAPCGAFATFTDITDRKRAEAHLRESEERYAALANASMDGLVVVDTSGRIQEVNDAYCAMLGYSREALLTMSIADVEARESPERAREHVERVASHGWERFESRQRRADGAEIDVQVSVIHVASRHQNVALISDITDRKRSEAVTAARLRLLGLPTEADVAAVLRATLDEVESLTGSTVGFCHFLSADETTISLQAWSTDTTERLCDVEVSESHYPVERAGVWVDCIHERGPVVHNSYADLPHRKGLPPGHVPIVRELVVPVMRGGTIVAVLGVGNKPTDYDKWDTEAVASLADLAWDIADARRAEEALRRSRESHQAFIDQSHEAIYCTEFEEPIDTALPIEEQIDAIYDGAYLGECNQSMVDMYGLPSVEAFVGQRLEAFHGGRDNPINRAVFRRFIEAGYRTADSETEETTPSGETRFFLSNDVGIVEEGRLTRIWGTAIDITDRRRAEEALRASQARLQLSLEVSGTSIWDLDCTTRAILVDGDPTVLGWDPSLLPTLDSWISVLHPDDVDRVRDHWHEHLSGRTEAFHSEHRYRTASGGWTWALVHGQVVERDADGRPVRVLGVHRSIDESKRAAEELRESEKRFRSLVESAPMSVLVLQDGRFALGNPASARLLGHDSAREIAGLDALGTIAPEYRDMVRGRVARIAEFQSNPPVEVEMVRRDGGRVWALLASAPILLDGRPAALIVGQDISEQKRAEAERVQLEARLQQAQRLEGLGVLAGGIAHDFNNILAGVQGFTEMALEEIEPTAAPATYLQHAMEGTARATELVRQILAFGRQAPTDQRPVLLALLVRDVLRFVRATLPTTVEIRQELDPETPPVLADPTQVHQVVLNLCTNAEHAMRPKGGILRVGLEAAGVWAGQATALGLAPGQYALLTVSDTGCGMDAGTKGRLFEPFFTTKPVGEGTGMGLATSHGIVAHHGGAIAVESEVGVGTTFRVYLPALAELAEQGPEPAAEDVPRGAGRVLLVDDEPNVLAAGESRLRSLGYTPTAVLSSVRALELLRSDPGCFDIIVTDQTMPEMTGLDLAAAVRETDVEIPIILTTGFSSVATPEAIARCGISAALPKPCTKRQLAETLRRVLDAADGSE